MTEAPIAEDRNQAEVVQTLEQYYANRVRPTMVDYGREIAGEHAALLAELERDYGIPGHFLLAIWGMESSFGRFTGGVPVLDALVTLAWDPRRADLFRGQRCFRHQLLLPRPYLVLTKPLRLDIQKWTPKPGQRLKWNLHRVSGRRAEAGCAEVHHIWRPPTK